MQSKENMIGHKRKEHVHYETVLSYDVTINCFNGEMPTFSDEICEKEITNLTHKSKASVKTQVYSGVLEGQGRHIDIV